MICAGQASLGVCRHVRHVREMVRSSHIVDAHVFTVWCQVAVKWKWHVDHCHGRVGVPFGSSPLGHHV